ncbi:DDE-type integrase/transposase/recombinase [Arthrospira platensis SPKY1]|nr:DDE-type integrase/transposase/recombinase [Arthrospira platensis SPKY1]
MSYGWSLQALYGWLGISRQAVSAGLKRAERRQQDKAHTLKLAHQIQQRTGSRGARSLYWADPQAFPFGRDRTEQLLLAAGFGRPKAPTSFTRTGRYALADLTQGLVLSGPNQLWQTDITYVWCAKRYYYLSFILDVFSRKIVAWRLSTSLDSANQQSLLQAAANSVPKAQRQGLIIHTDRGTQYGKAYQQLAAKLDMRCSMAHYSWNNAFIERLHRTFKELYIYPQRPTSLQMLAGCIKKGVYKYNTHRPHGCLPGRRSPNAFLTWWIQQADPKAYEYKLWSELTHISPLTNN